MRVLILGGSGMLGHKVWQTFRDRFDTFVTVRELHSSFGRVMAADDSRIIAGVTAENPSEIERAFAAARPDVVVNCIGVVKQDESAKNPITCITVNSLFPHRVAELASHSGARLIHVSTDCVFSGSKGNYSETDLPDPPDLYGGSKLLGEVKSDGHLTIRTSMIGRELKGSHGLLEWFLSQRGGRVRGFKRAVFSGLTTNALSLVISRIIVDHPTLSGVWHVAAEPISKFDLLTLVKQTYGRAIDIEADDSFVCDRSLNGTRFREATGIQPLSWLEMIEHMHNDPTPYDFIRSHQ